MVYSNDIVICDDNKGVVSALVQLLEISGMSVRTQLDSSKLIAQLNIDCPRLLIVDLCMPRVHGKELIAYFKSLPDYRRMYILCLSATLDGRSVALAAGADCFLAKPFDIQDIMNVVNHAMRLN